MHMSIVGQTARIDIGVTEALARYLAFGIDPGSLGMALLRGDRAAAYETAHPLLDAEHNTYAEDVVATMFEVTESAIPVFARGDDIGRWMKHKGLSAAPESIVMMTKLGIENEILWNYVMKHYPEAIRRSSEPA
jgi:hypothetical protein